jgi:hypothetical protein
MPDPFHRWRRINAQPLPPMAEKRKNWSLDVGNLWNYLKGSRLSQ